MATPGVDEEDDFTSITGEWKRDARTPIDADTPVEQHFLLQLRDTPDDLAMRMVFADWLEERGFPNKALVVRLLADPPIDGSEAMRELRAACACVDRDWLAIISRTPIDYCRGPIDPQGRLVCPRGWDLLKSTDTPRQRSCEQCGADVHFCASLDEVRERGEDRDTISISPNLNRGQALEAYGTVWAGGTGGIEIDVGETPWAGGTAWAGGTGGTEITIETEPIDDEDL